MATNTLEKNIWSSDKYYEKIAEIDDFSHPGFASAKEICANSKSILDVGCGDGSKLAVLGNANTKRVGCELGEAGIRLGRQKFPDIKFIHIDGNKLPFDDQAFESVCSFFVLEHTQKPDELICEMIRVLKVGGALVLLAPNFGTPNRCSPNFIGSRLKKLFTGFVNDFSTENSLNWLHVNPKISNIDEFAPDLDTTIEPYLGSLVKFLKYNKMEIKEWSSYWNMEMSNASLGQKIFKLFSVFGIYPFTMWGPHLFVVAKKVK